MSNMEVDFSTVSTPCSAYAAMQTDQLMIKSLLGGTRVMRLMGKIYLPTFEGESDIAYNFRLKNTTLYNHYKKAVQALTGKPFSKPIVYPEDITPELSEIADDFDLRGNDITIFTKNWFQSALSYGVSYVLVDYPDTGGMPYTLRDQKENKIRPYAVHIPMEDIIGWKTITVNGMCKLSQVRIKQCVCVDDGPFMTQDKDIIRVYDWFPDAPPGQNVKWTIYEELSSQSGKAWVITATGFLSGVTEIPLVPLYTGQTGYMTAEPPLLDLAYLNVLHWQVTSDHRHIMHILAVPILFAKGWLKENEPSKLQIGPNRMIISNSPDADLKYVEHSGVALGELNNYISNLQDQMTAMAIKLMAESRPGGVTATEVAVDAEAAESALKSMVLAAQDALEQVIYFMMQWTGAVPANGEVPQFHINKDFGLMIGNDMIAQWLLKANAQGIITKKTVGEGAKKIGYLDEDLDMDTELEAADEEAMSSYTAMESALSTNNQTAQQSGTGNGTSTSADTNGQ